MSLGTAGAATRRRGRLPQQRLQAAHKPKASTRSKQGRETPTVPSPRRRRADLLYPHFPLLSATLHGGHLACHPQAWRVRRLPSRCGSENSPSQGSELGLQSKPQLFLSPWPRFCTRLGTTSLDGHLGHGAWQSLPAVWGGLAPVRSGPCWVCRLVGLCLLLGLKQRVG